PPVLEGRRHIVAGVGHRPQQAYGDQLVAALETPDLGEQPDDLVKLGDALHAADLDACHRVHPGPPCRIAAMSPARSATRPSMNSSSACSLRAWAPPPTAPRPSRVGTPRPAVKF